MSSDDASERPDYQLSGEVPEADMRRPFAKYANKVLKGLVGSSKVINLGEEYGELEPGRIRLRDALEEGHLRLYIRQEADDFKKGVSENKVPIITSSVIAIGIVATGIYAIKHHKK